MAMRKSLARWSLRALTGMALLFCVAVVWWSHDPGRYTVPRWGALVLLYVLIGALALDLLARFTVAEPWNVLPVAGIAGLLYGAFAGGDFAALDFSLVTRPLGLYTLGGGVLGLAIVFWLLDGRGFVWWRAAILAWVGLAAGMWIRSFPLLESNPFPSPELPAVAAWLAGGLLVLGGLRWLVGWLAAGQRLDDLRLRNWELGVGGAVLLVAFFTGGGQGVITTFGGAVLGLLLGYMIVVLVFQRGANRPPLVERLMTPGPLPWRAGAIYGLALFVPTVFGFSLPAEGADGLALQAMLAIFTVFGVAWLPGLSVWLGFRAYIRLFRAEG